MNGGIKYVRYKSFRGYITEEEINKKKASELQYNIARQKLYLQFLVEMGILGDGKRYVNAKTKNYIRFIEEAQIPALSICRLIKEKHMAVHHFLISPNYAEKNPFRIAGVNGQLRVYNYETRIVGPNLELYYQTGTDPDFNRMIDSKYNNQTPNFPYVFNLPPNFQGALIFIQGQLERAFSLVGSQYDIAFGDVYDLDDVATECSYNDLFYYMKDYYSRHRTVYDYYTMDRGNKQYRLIYCHKK